MSKDKLIIFDRVDKYIKGNKILIDVSFDLKKGEVVGIVGSNGSGKTTILRLASGLSYATKGKIIINGKELKPGLFGELPNDIGILIESPTFLQHLTGFENLNILSKIKNKINEEDIYTTLKLVGLNPEDKRKVREYSLGMRQRLGIAQAIMENPSLILFDEPTSGLDLFHMRQVANVVNQVANAGRTALVVTHDPEFILRCCNYVLHLENGQIQESYSIEDSDGRKRLLKFFLSDMKKEVSTE